MTMRSDLEFKLIYAAIVAGKSANFADAAMLRLMTDSGIFSPFAWLQHLVMHRKLGAKLRTARTGNYTKLFRCFTEMTRGFLDLQNIEPEALEKIHGIGPKTSRFFILWTRPDAKFAALDVHVLRWLREQGYAAPKSTPQSGKAYRKLELIFLAEAAKRDMTPRALDYLIWQAGSKYTGEVQAEA